MANSRTKHYYDDFRVDQLDDGRWVIWVRSSPEDMEKYDLEDGVRKIFRQIEDWEETAEYISEKISEAKERRAELEERIKEGMEELRPLVEAGVLDELGIDYPWEYFRPQKGSTEKSRTKHYYDDFRVDQLDDGRWVIWVRSSPEDMEKYDLEDGVQEILTQVRKWEESAEYITEKISEAKERLAELTGRVKEGLEELRPLVEADVFDKLGSYYPIDELFWQYHLTNKKPSLHDYP